MPRNTERRKNKEFIAEKCPECKGNLDGKNEKCPFDKRVRCSMFKMEGGKQNGKGSIF